MGEFEDKINNILSSPEDMEKIMGIARSFSSGQGSGPSEGSPEKGQPGGGGGLGGLNLGGLNLGDIDPKILQMATTMMREYSSSSDSGNTALLTAMKPYLKQDRHEKIDKALQMAKMAKIARMAFSKNGGGKDDV